MKQQKQIRDKKRISCGTGTGRLAAAFAAMLMLAGCGNAAEEETPFLGTGSSEIQYEMADAEMRDVISTASVPATYTQLEEQEVAFSVGGKRIDKVYVSSGDEVKAGDLLAELAIGTLEEDIADLEYETEVLKKKLTYLDTQEKYDLEASYQTFAYHSSMEDDDITAQEKRDESIKQSYSDLREDYGDEIEFNELKLEELKEELSTGRLYATMSGTVTDVKSDLEGTTCKKDEVIMTVINGSEGLFIAESPEYAEYFSEDQSADMKIRSGSARGDYIVRPAEYSSWGDRQYFTVYDGPDSDGIDVGTEGQIEAVLGEKDNVLSVPTDTVFSADGKSYVYVLDEDGLKTVRWVETGLVGDEYTEILSGLTQGEQVVRE